MSEEQNFLDSEMLWLAELVVVETIYSSNQW